MKETHLHQHGHAHPLEDGPDSRCAPSINEPRAPEFHAGRSYKVRGLCCADEIAVLRQAVGPLVGGSDQLAFDLLNGRMSVAAAAVRVPEEAIIGAVAGTGLSAVPWTAPTGEAEIDACRRQHVFFTAASGAFVLSGLILHIVLAGGIVEA